MLYERWPFCLVAIATFNFEEELFQITTLKPLKQYDSNLVQKLLGKGQFKIAKIMVLCLLVWFSWQQKAPIDL